MLLIVMSKLAQRVTSELFTTEPCYEVLVTYKYVLALTLAPKQGTLQLARPKANGPRYRAFIQAVTVQVLVSEKVTIYIKIPTRLSYRHTHEPTTDHGFNLISPGLCQKYTTTDQDLILPRKEGESQQQEKGKKYIFISTSLG